MLNLATSISVVDVHLLLQILPIVTFCLSAQGVVENSRGVRLDFRDRRELRADGCTEAYSNSSFVQEQCADRKRWKAHRRQLASHETAHARE